MNWEVIMRAITADKGRDVNRTIVLLGVVWCAVQIADVKARVERLEARIIRQYAEAQKNTVAEISHRP